MGKASIWGWLVLAAIFFAGLNAQAAKPRKGSLARVLPSRVKTIHFQKAVLRRPKGARAPREEKRVSLPARSQGPRNVLQELRAKRYSAEIQDDAGGAYPQRSVYVARAVHWTSSDAALSADFDCNVEDEQQKKHEAELLARAQCQSSGRNEECRVAKVVIAKTGTISCRDFPGMDCPRARHVRGCIAEALVLGEKETPAELEPTEPTAVAGLETDSNSVE